MNVPNLKYDDFYKFVTSFCLIVIILSLVASTILLNSAYVGNVSEKAKKLFIDVMLFYILIASVAVYFLIWALKKWKINQDKLDKKLSAETEIRLLQVKKESAEYEKKIDELAKEESPFEGVPDFVKKLQRNKARKRIEG